MCQPLNCDVMATVCQLQFNLAEETLRNVIIGNRWGVREREMAAQTEMVFAKCSVAGAICDVFHLSLNALISRSVSPLVWLHSVLLRLKLALLFQTA